MGESARIVIVGGGLAGVEAAIYLRDSLGDRAQTTLITAQDTFVFRPYQAYIPFGLTPDHIQLDLRSIAAAHAFSLVTGHVDGIRLHQQVIEFGGQSIDYDYLIIATGASAVSEPIPGLAQAHAIWSESDMMNLRSRFRRLLTEARSGSRRRLLFLVPPHSAWTGPVYEMAFMTDTWLYWNDVRRSFDIQIATPELSYVEALGAEMHHAVAQDLERRSIEGLLGRRAVRVEANVVHFDDDTQAEFDVLIAGASYEGNPPGPGLPTDDRGFIQTRLLSRKVVGFEHVYAVGDGSDYPVKQGYLALVQADTAAEDICARIEGRAPGFVFDPSAMWMMDELDQALLAHSGEEGRPEDATTVERVPVGRLRRVQLMGHLPRRSGLGNPLYGGLLWKGTEVGLRILDQLSR